MESINMMESERITQEIYMEIRNNRIKEILKGLFIGTIGSFMVLLMIYVAFAQFFLNSIEGTISDKYAVSFLILGMSFISLISSIVVSMLIIDNVKRKSIVYASILSIICTETAIMMISFVSLLIYYPSVYENINGIEYLFTMPLSIVYLSIYVLDSFIYLFIIIVILYYMFFSIFLYFLYAER